MPSARARPQSEILQLQQEVFDEVQGDTEQLSQAIFGDVDNQPDLGSVSNERIDDIYRQAYQRGDRDFLQREARRDPEQFLKASERIGARVPPPRPQAPAMPPQPMMGPAMALPAMPMPGGAPPGMTGVGGPALPMPSPPAMPAVVPPPVPMAAGGLVTQPTLALIGEAGPEAVVPLQGYQPSVPEGLARVGQGASEQVPGQVEAGNVDLQTRPIVRNPDGTISTVRSISFEDDNGREVLIPTVTDDGRILSNRDAIDQYYATGRHLGIFVTPDAATAYALRLHQQQANQYGQ